MKDLIVDIKNLYFAYNGQVILENVSLDIRQGDFIAMIGPNGGGKTTLLKLMLGLLKVTCPRTFTSTAASRLRPSMSY
jgi:zinc transport system ATP-binding protein